MIKVNIDKAKEISHDIRRQTRDELFKPLDVQATIPMYAEVAEAERQKIREEFAEIQEKIDQAKTPEELKALVEQCQCKFEK